MDALLCEGIQIALDIARQHQAEQPQDVVQHLTQALNIIYTHACACITNDYAAYIDTLRDVRDRAKAAMGDAAIRKNAGRNDTDANSIPHQPETLIDCPFCGSDAEGEYAAGWEGAYCKNKSCFLHANEPPTRQQWQTLFLRVRFLVTI